jgi:hypothetical protein
MVTVSTSWQDALFELQEEENRLNQEVGAARQKLVEFRIGNSSAAIPEAGAGNEASRAEEEEGQWRVSEDPPAETCTSDERMPHETAGQHKSARDEAATGDAARTGRSDRDPR